MMTDLPTPPGARYLGGPRWLVLTPHPDEGPRSDGRQWLWRVVQTCDTQDEAVAVSYPFAQLGKVMVVFNEWGVSDGKLTLREGYVPCNHVGEPTSMICEGGCGRVVTLGDPEEGQASAYSQSYGGESPWPCGCSPLVALTCRPCETGESPASDADYDDDFYGG